MISRRAVLAGLVSRGEAGMMAAGLIARRGDGSLALKSIEGRALCAGRLRAFGVDDPFRVASISKMITATALMRLAPDLDFGLVAQIMERLTQTRFDLHMTQTMFAPLGLDTGYNWSGVSQARRDRGVAACRSVDGRWTPQLDAEIPPAPAVAIFRAPEAANRSEADYRLGENGLAFSPHGGLRLSLADMDRFAQLYARGEELLPRETLALMAKPAWEFTGANGNTENGFYQSFGLGLHAPDRELFFGDQTRDWRGHFGDAYGWMTGLFWNVRDARTMVWAINGMPETDRPRAPRSALTAPEEAIIDLALAATA